jgi:hypothetical protein
MGGMGSMGGMGGMVGMGSQSVVDAATQKPTVLKPVGVSELAWQHMQQQQQQQQKRHQQQRSINSIIEQHQSSDFDFNPRGC